MCIYTIDAIQIDQNFRKKVLLFCIICILLVMLFFVETYNHKSQMEHESQVQTFSAIPHQAICIGRNAPWPKYSNTVVCQDYLAI